jgi:integrase
MCTAYCTAIFKNSNFNKMKVAFYLTRPESTNPTSIFARISYNGLQLKYYTSENIIPRNWNKTTQRAKQSEKFKEYPEFNARIDKVLFSIRTVFRIYQNDNLNKVPSTAHFKYLLDKEFKKTVESQIELHKLRTFWGFFDNFLDRSKSGTRLHIQNNTPLALNTIKNFKNLYSHLQEFQNYQKRRIDFETIDMQFYNSFIQYLTERKLLAINTIGKLITNLKVLLREALENGYSNNMIFTHKKFKSFQAETDAIYLSESEIRDILSLDLTTNNRLERVRDLFIIGCHTGLRFSDLSKLSHTHIKNGVIHLRQTKTGKSLMIPIKEDIEYLFAKYPDQIPGKISNQKFNEYLKELCALVPSLQKEYLVSKIAGGKKTDRLYKKFELVQSHTARRSFATNEYLAGDLQPFEIRAITGHKTDKAFYKYIRQTPQENALNIARKWRERSSHKLLKESILKAV